MISYSGSDLDALLYTAKMDGIREGKQIGRIEGWNDALTWAGISEGKV